MLIRKQNFNITWQNCTYSIIFQISNHVWTANDSSKHNNLIKVSVSVQINTEKKNHQTKNHKKPPKNQKTPKNQTENPQQQQQKLVCFF